MMLHETSVHIGAVSPDLILFCPVSSAVFYLRLSSYPSLYSSVGADVDVRHLRHHLHHRLLLYPCSSPLLLVLMYVTFHRPSPPSSSGVIFILVLVVFSRRRRKTSAISAKLLSILLSFLTGEKMCS